MAFTGSPSKTGLSCSAVDNQFSIASSAALLRAPFVYPYLFMAASLNLRSSLVSI